MLITTYTAVHWSEQLTVILYNIPKAIDYCKMAMAICCRFNPSCGISDVNDGRVALIVNAAGHYIYTGEDS